MTASHILLVDDDVELTELLADYLTTEGLEISVANSAEQALGAASTASTLRSRCVRHHDARYVRFRAAATGTPQQPDTRYHADGQRRGY